MAPISTESRLTPSKTPSNPYDLVQHLHLPAAIFFKPAKITKTGQIIPTKWSEMTPRAPNSKVRPKRITKIPIIM